VSVAFLIAAIGLALRPQSSVARRGALTAAAAFVFATIFVVPDTMGWMLFTHRYHPFVSADGPPGRVAVVLLGGGADTVHGIGDTTLAVPSGDGLERVLEAARIFQLTHAEWLISSGGTLDPRQERDGITMRDQLVRIGIPAERIVVESESKTTHEQAALVSPILRSLGATGVILVTSDIHMLRSLGAFRAYGIDAVSAIAPSTHASDPLARRLLPSVNGMMRSQQLSHEVFGIIYYRVRGWWR